MTIAEKITRAKTDYDEVYEAGKQAEYDSFWDTFQENGGRYNYQYAFSGMPKELFKPKYRFQSNKTTEVMYYGKFLTIPCLMSMSNAFAYFEIDNFDELLERIPNAFIFDAVETVTNFFYQSVVTRLPKIWIDYPQEVIDWLAENGDTSSLTINCNGIFRNCGSLVTVEELHLLKECTFNSAFAGCSKLENIKFTGEIGKAISLSVSPKLTKESILSLFNCLINISTSIAVQLGTTNLAKLTNEEKAIATSKGWTLT